MLKLFELKEMIILLFLGQAFLSAGFFALKKQKNFEGMPNICFCGWFICFIFALLVLGTAQ